MIAFSGKIAMRSDRALLLAACPDSDRIGLCVPITERSLFP